MRAIIVAFSVLFAASLAAATIKVEPAAPTSATPVTLAISEYVTCAPPPQLTRSGNTISVVIDPGPCLSPSFLRTFTFPLGVLAPGDYEVITFTNGRSGYATFYVRDADPKVFISGSSIGPVIGGTEVSLFAPDAFLCYGPDPQICPLPAVTFNGVPATVVRDRFVQGSLVVITPPNTKGIAEVAVTGTRGTLRGRIFRYYDPNEAPVSSMFERILFPVWFFGPGAFGSNWTTELTLRNNSNYRVSPWHPLPSSVICPLVPCETAITPTSTLSVGLGPARAGGVLFFPPRDLSSSLEFGSLVRDTSRQAEDWGTEVRVTGESEFRTGTFSLLNVPIDPRFRSSVRIYGVDSVESTVSLTIYASATDQQLARRALALRSPNPCKRFEPCASDDPAFAMINDLAAAFPELTGANRVRIEIAAQGDRVWAFSTITNNQTQHVTVISPQ